MSQKVHICKTFRLEAAHVLPNHDGKCRRLHGHSYTVALELAGDVCPADGSPGEGMVIDFGHVKTAWSILHARLDHQLLNDVIPPDFHPTTAENIAAYVLSALTPTLPLLVAVRVHETATSWAEVRR